MGVPTNGTVCDLQGYVMRELQDRYGDEVELVWPDVLCQRIFHDAARNGIVGDFLKTDCDILWFLDSDVVPTKHVLDLVVMHGDQWLCAGAPYPIFMSPPGEVHRQIVITAYRGLNEKKTAIAPVTQIPFNGTAWVDGLATGCMMLKREVFDKIERPYFEFKYHRESRTPIEGEDLGFCLKMCALGIQFFTDYSMICKHYKNQIDLLEMNNYCISFAQKSLKAFERDTRKQVEAYVAQLKEKKQQAAAAKRWSSGNTQFFPSR